MRICGTRRNNISTKKKLLQLISHKIQFITDQNAILEKNLRAINSVVTMMSFYWMSWIAGCAKKGTHETFICKKTLSHWIISILFFFLWFNWFINNIFYLAINGMRNKLNIDCWSRKDTSEVFSPRFAELIIFFLCLYESSWGSLGFPRERFILWVISSLLVCISNAVVKYWISQQFSAHKFINHKESFQIFGSLTAGESCCIVPLKSIKCFYWDVEKSRSVNWKLYNLVVSEKKNQQTHASKGASTPSIGIKPHELEK